MNCLIKPNLMCNDGKSILSLSMNVLFIVQKFDLSKYNVTFVFNTPKSSKKKTWNLLLLTSVISEVMWLIRVCKYILIYLKLLASTHSFCCSTLQFRSSPDVLVALKMITQCLQPSAFFHRVRCFVYLLSNLIRCLWWIILFSFRTACADTKWLL